MAQRPCPSASFVPWAWHVFRQTFEMLFIQLCAPKTSCAGALSFGKAERSRKQERRGGQNGQHHPYSSKRRAEGRPAPDIPVSSCQPFPFRLFFLLDGFRHMPHRHHRVMQQHARAGIAHHLADFLAHLRLVAMRFTVKDKKVLSLYAGNAPRAGPHIPPVPGNPGTAGLWASYGGPGSTALSSVAPPCLFFCLKPAVSRFISAHLSIFCTVYDVGNAHRDSR